MIAHRSAIAVSEGAGRGKEREGVPGTVEKGRQGGAKGREEKRSGGDYRKLTPKQPKAGMLKRLQDSGWPIKASASKLTGSYRVPIHRWATVAFRVLERFRKSCTSSGMLGHSVPNNRSIVPRLFTPKGNVFVKSRF